MLLSAVFCLALACLGFVAVAKVAHVATGRLGLDPIGVLLFFGLAEEPRDELALRRAVR